MKPGNRYEGTTKTAGHEATVRIDSGEEEPPSLALTEFRCATIVCTHGVAAISRRLSMHCRSLAVGHL